MAGTPRIHHKNRARKSHSIDNKGATYLQPSVSSAEAPRSPRREGQSMKRNARLKLLRTLFAVDRGASVDRLFLALGPRDDQALAQLIEGDQAKRDLAVQYIESLRDER